MPQISCCELCQQEPPVEERGSANTSSAWKPQDHAQGKSRTGLEASGRHLAGAQAPWCGWRTPSAARPAGPAPGLRSSIAGQPPLSQSAEAAPPYPRTPASGQTHPAAQGARPEPSYKVPTFYSSLPFAVLEKLLFYPFPQKHVISNRRLTAHAASSQLLKSLGHFREHKGLRRQTLRTAGSTAQSP